MARGHQPAPLEPNKAHFRGGIGFVCCFIWLEGAEIDLLRVKVADPCPKPYLVLHAIHQNELSLWSEVTLNRSV